MLKFEYVGWVVKFKDKSSKIIPKSNLYQVDIIMQTILFKDCPKHAMWYVYIRNTRFGVLSEQSESKRVGSLTDLFSLNKF